jgi:hypothetical protein
MVNADLLNSLVKQAGELTTQLEIDRAKKDPYFFLTHFCYTLDEHDPEAPYKLIPKKAYVQDLCDLFVTENLLAIEKSRQMMVSWIFCGLALWFTMFRQGARTLIMSKKEKDADAMVDRIKRIYERLPEKLKEEYKADPFKYLHLQWSKRDSVIQGVAQGPDQVRQYTCSLIIMDEAAFQDKAEKVYEAVKPSLVGGGKLVVISTPNGRNWFYRCVRDLF